MILFFCTFLAIVLIVCLLAIKLSVYLYRQRAIPQRSGRW